MYKAGLVIYCDGGSRGNPGPAASAFVVTEDGKVIYKDSKYLGVETNNVTEYTAVLIALDWLIKENINREIIFNLDSQLIERQINGLYRVRNTKLIKLHDKVKMKLKKIKQKVEFKWNYRKDNELADTLVNKTLDIYSMKHTTPSTGK